MHNFQSHSDSLPWQANHHSIMMASSGHLVVLFFSPVEPRLLESSIRGGKTNIGRETTNFVELCSIFCHKSFI